MFKSGVNQEVCLHNKLFCICKPIVSLKSLPKINVSLETECLLGEKCEILSCDGEWVFCRVLKDGYKGWIKKISLGRYIEPTHKVNVKNTILFNKPSVKSAPYNYISFGSEIKIEAVDENWGQIYIFKKNKVLKKFIPISHLVEINHVELDWVKTAEMFLHTPYKWGGKSFLGIDCSALCQISLLSKYKNISRNSSQQEIEIGQKIYNQENISDLKDLKRGDLVFWTGHVGIMINNQEIIHANAFHVRVEKEQLLKAIKRMKQSGLTITSVNRVN